jgi:hypothetical protein
MLIENGKGFGCNHGTLGIHENLIKFTLPI